MRLVLDTNVLFAGVAARGLCEALVALCLRSCTIITSEHILAELDKHLRGKIKLPEATRREYLALLRMHGKVVEPTALPRSECRDADDLPVLGTAIAGAAAALVTGDQDMLVLKQVRDIPIVTPRAMYERLMN